ncbi:MAG: hypothetical protein AB7E85_09055 [Pseudobdellovibrionaceae bacterium]
MTDTYLSPRFRKATTDLGENAILWQALLDQSDNFAYQTANEGKGGPFGAQLWLVHEDTKTFLLVGDEDSNAVVSKGLANAHAEAENLSPANRLALKDFLQAHQGEGWKVVQVSSAESCQSCRSKQVLLARELIDAGLLETGDFRVIFKATYDQTRDIAGFNDAPFDTTFRYIAESGVLDMKGRLLNLEDTIQSDPVAAQAVAEDVIVYVPVREGETPEGHVRDLFEKMGDRPFCVITDQDGNILSFASDTRDPSAAINEIEKTPIVAALHIAAANKRAEGHFESWDLDRARIYTNCTDLGPLSYAETLWYNIDSITNVTDFDAQNFCELPGRANAKLFAQVCAEYNSEDALIHTIYANEGDKPSAAHLLWKARMAREELLRAQADRLDALENDGVVLGALSGMAFSPSALIASDTRSSNYDGKQGGSDPAP